MLLSKESIIRMNNSRIKKNIDQMILIIAMVCIIAALLLGIALYSKGSDMPTHNRHRFQECKISASMPVPMQNSIAELTLPDRFLNVCLHSIKGSIVNDRERTESL
jgi:hypothetical protein